VDKSSLSTVASSTTIRHAFLIHYSAKDTGVIGLDIDTNFAADASAGLKSFAAAIGVSMSAIRAEGISAISTGTHRWPGKKSASVQGSSTSVNVYRRLTDNWALTDGTREASDEDTAVRFTVFPRWNNNSCAIDCTLFVGIMLNAGRSIVDTLPTTPLTRAQKSHPSHAFRSILHVLWGTLDSQQHDALRDRLAARLAIYDSERFTRGNFISVADVLETCFASFASVSFTAMTRGARLCCDGIVQYSERITCRDITVIHLSHAHEGSFEDIINEYFGPRALECQSTCSKGQRCTRQWSRRFVIVDDGYRLPPTFIVHLTSTVTPSQATKMSIFDGPVSIRVQFPDLEATRTYIAVGCILLRYNSHFTSRWRVSAHEFVEYDGMDRVYKAGRRDKKAGVIHVNSFLSRLPEERTSIVAIILRVQEDNQQWGGKSI
jgi:hypothetical protein